MVMRSEQVTWNRLTAEKYPEVFILTRSENAYVAKRQKRGRRWYFHLKITHTSTQNHHLSYVYSNHSSFSLFFTTNLYDMK